MCFIELLLAPFKLIEYIISPVDDETIREDRVDHWYNDID